MGVRLFGNHCPGQVNKHLVGKHIRSPRRLQQKGPMRLMEKQMREKNKLSPQKASQS